MLVRCSCGNRIVSTEANYLGDEVKELQAKVWRLSRIAEVAREHTDNPNKDTMQILALELDRNGYPAPEAI